MTITLNGGQRLLTVNLDGEIDHHNATLIKNAVEKEIRRTGAVNIAFNFSKVTFMDSSGIGLILGRYKTVKSLGGKIFIYGANYEIERLLMMSGISKVAEIYGGVTYEK